MRGRALPLIATARLAPQAAPQAAHRAAPQAAHRAALLAALLSALLVPGPGMAQGLVLPRPQAVVEGGTVTLGDLFDNAGREAARVLGPAPPPGRRFVVEAPQLAIIARDNGLPWRPQAGDERVVVERPGRPLAREEVEAVLRAELILLGADPSLDLELMGFQPPLVPAGPEPRLALEGTEYDGATRRFAATLVVLADGMATLRLRLAGRSVAMREVVVATRTLRAGEVLSPRDIRADRLPAERVRPGMAERLETALGRRLERPLSAGQPVPLADLAVAQTIRRDSVVALIHESPGLSLTTRGRALEDGPMGGTITVLNLSNGSLLLGEVLGADRVRALGPAPAAALPPGAARLAQR
ncbi:flagellar basal body P-ring formation chaperone FlgA [Roseomonas sp. GC11]|uniref:flagellar basal body P-ring formation chaperone FlgA n=1 Tax=Roseomonas sp. GC11 TaxID=2950546 RepID=UPI00210F0936|nr:flagellar basal body P-ring formation chaperone FlgA [Roseomonas sp. GC11]MCQ4162274.1 flagellar basal body P-ring formation chaperone FlgA [Roseomonas sp. GC11]